MDLNVIYRAIIYWQDKALSYEESRIRECVTYSKGRSVPVDKTITQKEYEKAVSNATILRKVIPLIKQQIELDKKLLE